MEEDRVSQAEHPPHGNVYTEKGGKEAMGEGRMAFLP